MACHRDLTATMPLLRSSHGVQSHSYGVLFCDTLTTLLLSFHDAHYASTVLWQRSQWHLKECRTISMQMPGTRPQRVHNHPCACSQSSCYIAGDLNARLWRLYGGPTALLLESQPQRLFWACSECVASFGILCNLTLSTADSLRFWGDACDRTACTSTFCIFSWMPWDLGENAALVWQGLTLPYKK